MLNLRFQPAGAHRWAVLKDTLSIAEVSIETGQYAINPKRPLKKAEAACIRSFVKRAR